MHDLRIFSVMFGPVLWQINRVRVNRCPYRCVCMYSGARQRVVTDMGGLIFCLAQDGVSWSVCEKSNC